MGRKMGRKMGSMIRNMGSISLFSAIAPLTIFFGSAMMRFILASRLMVGFFGCVLSYSLGTNPRGVKDS
jgi:hypothetical protein